MTVQDMFAETRHLPFGGTFNFRDVGGYPSRFGGRTRWQMVYRADSLHRLSESAQQKLVDNGLRTVVDLRRDTEIADHPNVFAHHPAVRYHNVTVQPVDAPTPDGKADGDRFDLLAVYTRIIDFAKEPLRDVLSLIADPDRLPCVVHCTAGKDRTGVVIALILSAVGVDPDDIAADYQMSERFLTGVYFEEAKERAKKAGVAWTQYQKLLVCPAHLMTTVLDYVTARYGGVEAYLGHIGLGAHQLETLRQTILDQGRTSQ